MKSRPILFSAPMVRALLNGIKTQTRCVVKGSEKWPVNTDHCAMLSTRGSVLAVVGKTTYAPEIKCPYGQPGDQLWVRETFQPTFADGVERDDTDWETGKGYAVRYMATESRIEWIDGDDNITDHCKSSIHMPRWASRITLEITGVRVERLMDINERDAQAEGAMLSEGPCTEPEFQSYTLGYLNLWNSINGLCSWVTNPWVWVIEFRRCEVPA